MDNQYKIINKSSFHIGGLFEKWNLVKALIVLHDEHPEMFVGRIVSIYGARHGMIWNGGRYIVSQNNLPSNQEIRDFLLVHNIRPCLIVSNLTETRMDDVAVSVIEDFGVTNLDFCVGNEHIEDMLLALGASYSQFALSTTKCLDIVDIIKSCTKYNRVVLSEELNNHFMILQNLDRQQIHSHLEVLVNAPCSKPCPKRYEHYLCISHSNSNHTNDHPRCLTGKNCAGPLSQIKCNELFVDLDGMVRYINLGVTHFKLSGRTHYDWDWINTVVYYTVLPPYRDFVREELLMVAYKD